MTEHELQILTGAVAEKLIGMLSTDKRFRRVMERAMYISGKQDEIAHYIWCVMQEVYHVSMAYYDGLGYVSDIIIHMLKYGENRKDAIKAVAENRGKKESQVKYQIKTMLAYTRSQGHNVPNQQKLVEELYEKAVSEFCLGRWV